MTSTVTNRFIDRRCVGELLRAGLPQPGLRAEKLPVQVGRFEVSAVGDDDPADARHRQRQSGRTAEPADPRHQRRRRLEASLTLVGKYAMADLPVVSKSLRRAIMRGSISQSLLRYATGRRRPRNLRRTSTDSSADSGTWNTRP